MRLRRVRTGLACVPLGPRARKGGRESWEGGVGIPCSFCSSGGGGGRGAGLHFFGKAGGPIIVEGDTGRRGDIGPDHRADGYGIGQVIGVGDCGCGIYEIDNSLNVHLVEGSGCCCCGAHRVRVTAATGGRGDGVTFTVDPRCVGRNREYRVSV